MVRSNNSTQIDNVGVSSLQYPRTGKRGVPQQFPRRLFEMLQSESTLIEASADHPKIIFWSDSGRAFRIADVAEFSTTILPKYFRTKKFSSFQRNLNLYGFAKVRRGPETDMYAHPSFARNQADSLSELRKLNSTTSRRRNRDVSGAAKRSKATAVSRSVSPSPTLMLANAEFPAPTSMVVIPSGVVKPKSTYMSSPQLTSVWSPIHKVPPSPDASNVFVDQSTTKEPSNCVGRGRLDLLALAMEQAAIMQH